MKLLTALVLLTTIMFLSTASYAAKEEVEIQVRDLTKTGITMIGIYDETGMAVIPAIAKLALFVRVDMDLYPKHLKIICSAYQDPYEKAEYNTYNQIDGEGLTTLVIYMYVENKPKSISCIFK